MRNPNNYNLSTVDENIQLLREYYNAQKYYTDTVKRRADRFYYLKSQGWTLDEISKTFKVSKQFVSQVLQRRGGVNRE